MDYEYGDIIEFEGKDYELLEEPEILDSVSSCGGWGEGICLNDIPDENGLVPLYDLYFRFEYYESVDEDGEDGYTELDDVSINDSCLCDPRTNEYIPVE